MKPDFQSPFFKIIITFCVFEPCCYGLDCLPLNYWSPSSQSNGILIYDLFNLHYFPKGPKGKILTQ